MQDTYSKLDMRRVFVARDVLWGILSNRLRASPQCSTTRAFCRMQNHIIFDFRIKIVTKCRTKHKMHLEFYESNTQHKTQIPPKQLSSKKHCSVVEVSIYWHILAMSSKNTHKLKSPKKNKRAATNYSRQVQDNPLNRAAGVHKIRLLSGKKNGIAIEGHTRTHFRTIMMRPANP